MASSCGLNLYLSVRASLPVPLNPFWLLGRRAPRKLNQRSTDRVYVPSLKIRIVLTLVYTSSQSLTLHFV